MRKEGFVKEECAGTSCFDEEGRVDYQMPLRMMSRLNRFHTLGRNGMRGLMAHVAILAQAPSCGATTDGQR